MEDYTTKYCLEYHQDADNTRIINIRLSVSGIIHTLLGITVSWKLQIQPAVESESTDGEILCMYKDVNKTKSICWYTEAWALHTGAPTVHWEANNICISVVEDKIVTHRFKYIDIHVCFLQEQFENGIFVPKYEKSSVMPVDISTKPCSGPNIVQNTKWMTRFRLYTTSDTEHYRFMILHGFVVN